jgi:hypothetical protein
MAPSRYLQHTRNDGDVEFLRHGDLRGQSIFFEDLRCGARLADGRFNEYVPTGCEWRRLHTLSS